MKVQDYNEGEIHRNNDGKYEYVVKGEVQGTYPSVSYLVNAYPEVGGNNNRKVQTTESAEIRKEASKRSRKS